MFTRIDAVRLLGAALVLVAVAGCYKEKGGSPELCNGVDDDWSGIVDDPFVDAAGLYYQLENCGGCGIDCRTVFPTASEVECATADGVARCAITACPTGKHLVGDSFCAPDQDALCLPCASDAECRLLDPTAVCVVLPGGDGRCAPACGEAADAGPGDAGPVEVDGCPDGFTCGSADGVGPSVCTPTSGSCACTPEESGLTLACWVENPAGDQLCAGSQTCDGLSVTDCAPIFAERCNGVDDDCDGETDEDFLTDGEYLSDDHCGACNHPCTSTLAHMTGACELGDDGPECTETCVDGFVDVDGVQLNGCECEMTAGTWPPTAFGGDGNCDGVLDDLTPFVFVSKYGDDADPGTLELPVRTIGRGIEIAAPGGKAVIVADGVYDEQVQLAAGASVFGGYRSDFQDRDTSIYEVEIRYTSGPAGYPGLVADGIRTATEVGGITVTGTDAEAPGHGTTAVLLTDCGPELAFADVLVNSGDGTDGTDGQSSSALMAALGVTSSAMLDGAAGSNGGDGIDSGQNNCSGHTVAAGSGGAMTCPLTGADVSGGGGGDATCPNTGCTIGDPCGNGGCTDYMTSWGCDFDAVYADAVPNPSAEDGHGSAGGAAGPVTYDAPTTRWGSSFCEDNPTLRREGGDGEAGGEGADGSGGSGGTDPAGLFDAANGLWSGVSGTDGAEGADGSGGGGGTAGNGYDRLSGAAMGYTDHLGGSGGGGGSGGCGALGATGGMGGGGSIGVAILVGTDSAGPTFENVLVIAGQAGAGGDGGQGMGGGAPGASGLGGDGNFWCARTGGRGGDGGQGGSGGGGGGGGGGSISGFHVVATTGADAFGYVGELAAANEVSPLPAPGSAGSAGFSPGNPGVAGVAGTATAYRLVFAD
jgi:hypothetical protein